MKANSRQAQFLTVSALATGTGSHSHKAGKAGIGFRALGFRVGVTGRFKGVSHGDSRNSHVGQATIKKTGPEPMKTRTHATEDSKHSHEGLGFFRVRV